MKAEVRELIATMARENWGTERIRGELLKLGVAVGDAPSAAPTSGTSPAAQPELAHLLAHHAQAIWAADLFVVQALSFQTLTSSS